MTTLVGSSLKITSTFVFLRKEGAGIMVSINAFSGVGVAGMARTLHAAAAAAVAAHPAFTPRKRRTAAATGASVDRGTI